MLVVLVCFAGGSDCVGDLWFVVVYFEFLPSLAVCCGCWLF